MICNQLTSDSPWVCTEMDGTPIPDSDPRVVAHAEAFAFAAATPAPTAGPTPSVDPAPRAAACAFCEYRRSDTDRCSLMSCGCSLTSRQASPFAICPDNRWPLHLSANT